MAQALAGTKRPYISKDRDRDGDSTGDSGELDIPGLGKRQSQEYHTSGRPGYRVPPETGPAGDFPR